MPKNQTLLADFIENQSQAAFSKLVCNYVNLVFSVALRITGDRQYAEDVTQIVFSDLARMSPKFSKNILLGGWLHRHTCYLASTFMRAERRRQTRERKATEMNAIEDHSGANLASLRPILDEAINRLDEGDRNAVLLRFIDQKDFNEVGEALGIANEAARKRVNRALEKLRVLLAKRGVALSGVALASTLTAEAAITAPVGLGIHVANAALIAAANNSVTATNLLIMGSTKTKVAIAIAATVTGLVTTLVLEHQTNRNLRLENQLFRQQLEASQLVKEGAGTVESKRSSSSPTNDPNFHEILRLRGQVGLLQNELDSKKDELVRNKLRENEKVDTGQPSLPSEDVQRIFTLSSLQDVGLGSPEAAVQTYLWTKREVMTTNSFDEGNQRAKEVVFTPPGARYGGYAKDGNHSAGPLRDYKFLNLENVTYQTPDRATVRVQGYDNNSPGQGTIYRAVRDDGLWKVDIGIGRSRGTSRD